MRKTITTLALATMFGFAGIASAQTTTPATGQTTGADQTTTDTSSGAAASDSSNVGVPNTGAGGNAPINFAILGTSAAIVLAAGAYALRRNTILNTR